MNAAGGGQSDEFLDAYLDDRLDAGQRGAFRDRLARESGLAAELATQRQIDRSLAEQFVAPRYPGMPGDVLRFPAPDRASAGPARLSSVPVSQTRGVIWGSLIGAALFCLTWLLYTQLTSKSYSLHEAPAAPQHMPVASDAPQTTAVTMEAVSASGIS